MNLNFSAQIISRLAGLGVSEFCLCAGARNAPLVKVLGQWESQLKVWRFFDERSAAFFALGRARSLGQPVAIVTTSGTAAAEVLPAIIEAHYSGAQLVLITADRPRRYRGTAAPQSIEQVGLYSHYVKHSYDIEAGERAEIRAWSPGESIHLNLCFDEPLLTGEFDLKAPAVQVPTRHRGAFGLTSEQTRLVLEKFFKQARRPLIIAGELPFDFQAEAAIELARLQRPIYAEALSGLRDREELSRWLLCSGERLLSSRVGALEFDSVIRLGRVPTLRFWRDLEASDLPVLQISDLAFSGLPRAKDPVLPLRVLSELNQFVGSQSESREIFQLDGHQASRLQKILENLPSSEPSLFKELSERLPSASRIFLGNSLPIREWDLAATRRPRHFELFASRGANGIDGNFSTFLGLAESGRQNFAVVGDLTALYDLNAPWIFPQLPVGELGFVIVNNGGGQIFERVFRDPAFINAHSRRFSAFAAMWDMPYYFSRGAVPDLAESRRVIEIEPDTEQTHAFWREYDQSWSAI